MNLEPLIARLKLSEGFSPTVYMDTTGNLTIGYGHNLAKLVLPLGVSFKDVKILPVNGVTRTIAEALLVNVLVDSLDALRRGAVWLDQLDDVRQRVLADMAYNMGAWKLLHEWPIFMGQVQRGEYEAAARNMLGTPWRRQVGDRAVRLAYMMQHGKEPE